MPPTPSPTPPSPTPPSPTPPSPTPPSPTPPSPTPPSPTPPTPTPPTPTPPIPPIPAPPEYPAAINSFNPSDSPVGTGTAFIISPTKDLSVTLQYQDVYDNVIDNELQLAQGLAQFSYRTSLYTTGATVGNVSPYLVAENFKTNQQSLQFSFLKTENASYFGSSGAQRYYDILFNVLNEGLENSVLATVYHLPAQISRIQVSDFNTGVFSGITGQVIFDLSFSDDAVSNYITRSVDVYTGANPSASAYSLNGFSLLKNVPFLQNAQGQTVSIFAPEVPNNQTIYYQFVPYDDFGTGYVYVSGVSGYLRQDPDPLVYGYGIPPVLDITDRTGVYFSGYATNQNSELDGSLIYQTGASGQKLMLIQSGQWKQIPTTDDVSGNYVPLSRTGYFLNYVNPPENALSSGVIGEYSLSGRYLFIATGNDSWGRVLLESDF